MKSRLTELFETRKVIVTCGTGGVGKTTMSAALAVRAAMEGKKVVVVTLDPAKRLKDSLGVEGLGDAPTDLTPLLSEKAKARGSDVSRVGLLHAVVPDTKRTFEQLAEMLTSDGVLRERLYQNPIFQVFTKEFSGANEYMAIQKLNALRDLEKYDLIIVDTPPSRNTLEFLEAPGLLSRLFEEKWVRMLVEPAGKLFSGGLGKVLGLLEKLAGAEFLKALVEFVKVVFDVRVAFVGELDRLLKLLKSPEVGFVFVSQPSPDTLKDLRLLLDRIEERGLRFDGLVMNRMLGLFEIDAEKWPADPEWKAAREVIDSLRQREEKVVAQYVEVIYPFSSKGKVAGDQLLARIPECIRDVHSMEDLLTLAEQF